MRPLAHLYSTFLAAGVLGTVPLWGGLVAAKPKHRAGLLQKAMGVGPQPDPAGPSPIWYHAVSVGEVMASLPLLKELAALSPARPLWLSTVTATGQATARARLSQTAETFYFPYDFPWIVDRVIRRLRPAVFITTETELWPNCIWRLHRYGVPVVLVNGRISDRSFKWYARFRFLFREVLGCFQLLCMQSEASATRIRYMGAPEDRIVLTGNLKFDLALPDPADRRTWRDRLGLAEETPVIVAGSTHPGEEEILLRIFGNLRRQFHGLTLIVAPRAPERFHEVEGLISQMGFRLLRRTKGPRGVPQEVILLDTVGELNQVYGVANVGFVGGSLIPHGGQNPLEVAAHSLPVLFGPHMENFRESASLLLESQAAMACPTENALGHALHRLLSEPAERASMGNRAFEALVSHRGAARTTAAAIRPFLEGSPWG